jgi:phosphomannomutase
MSSEIKIKFGTDGFRSIICDSFTYENIRIIAQGFCEWLAYNGYKKSSTRIFVGYDRRFFSDRFAREFATVLINNDFDCVLSKTAVTTPMVSYLTTQNFTFGIMITASHNHYLYNGVKIKYQGRSVLPRITAEMEMYIDKIKKSYISRIPKKEILEEDLRNEYINYLTGNFKINDILKKINGKVVFDFMYGSGADIYGLLFNSKKIVAINTEIDPLFGEINSPEPVESKLSKLKEVVKKEKAICGFALDGDGDRFAIVDEKGNYFTPQKVAPMILNYLVEKKNMKGRVVQAVSLGYLTQRIAREKNFIFEFTPVGFKYIADRISMGDTIFGAEESGGYCWKGNIPERDGFMTSLIFLEMISEMGLSITKIYENIKNKYGDSYFIREDLHVEKIPFSKYSYAVKIKSKLPKTILNKNIKEVLTLDGIKVILENDWWFLIRPSGTEPLIRIYAEAENEKSVKDLIKFAKEISVI